MEIIDEDEISLWGEGESEEATEKMLERLMGEVKRLRMSRKNDKINLELLSGILGKGQWNAPLSFLLKAEVAV